VAGESGGRQSAKAEEEHKSDGIRGYGWGKVKAQHQQNIKKTFSKGVERSPGEMGCFFTFTAKNHCGCSHFCGDGQKPQILLTTNQAYSENPSLEPFFSQNQENQIHFIRRE